MLEIVNKIFEKQIEMCCFFLMIVSKVNHYLISVFPHENYILQMNPLNF